MKTKFYTWVTAMTVIALSTFTLGFSESKTPTVTPQQEEVVLAPVKDITIQLKPVTVSNVKVPQKPKETVVISTFHKVTTEYLNVRESNSRTSKIIDVLVKDYVVETIDYDNGWLKLKSGGYIHYKYATKLTQDEAKKLLTVQNTKPKPKPVFAKPVVKATPKKTLAKETKSTTTDSVEVVAQPVASGTPQVGVTTPSNLSGEHFEQIVAGTQLAGIGHAIAQVEQQYGINGFFTLAVAKLESGNGSSRLAQNKNNIFGMNAIDSNPYNAAFTYESKSHSVLDFGARLKKNYIDRGLTTLPSINAKYSSSSSWSTKVNQIMYGDLNKVY